MLVHNIPPKTFGRENRRHSSLSSLDENDSDTGSSIATQQDEDGRFLKSLADALVRNLLGANKKTARFSQRPLSGQTTLTLAENRPDNFYQKNCKPCKETYKSHQKQNAHKEMFFEDEIKTVIRI